MSKQARAAEQATRGRLGEQAEEAFGSDWRRDLHPMLQRLSRHYIAARYPDAHPSGNAGTHYGEGDSDAAITDAETVIGASTTYGTRCFVGVADLLAQRRADQQKKIEDARRFAVGSTRPSVCNRWS